MTGDLSPNINEPVFDDAQEAELLPSKIYLIDRSDLLVDEWSQQYSDCPEVQAIAGDYFHKPADALVSPANSFGIMDGGLDLAIRDQLGFVVEQRIQQVIVEKYHGEMPVGCAEVIITDDSRWPYMVAAPTMRIPEPIPSTLNAYLAFRSSWWRPKTSTGRRANGRLIHWCVAGLARASAGSVPQNAPGKCGPRIK
jgi:hypothetical protein